MGPRPVSTMIATLGGQPQVVTFALDALLERGEPIGEVVVIHFAPHDPRTRQALERLDREFPNDFYAHAQRPIRLRRVVLRDHHGPLVDIVDERTADAVRAHIVEILRLEKAQGRPLHVVLAGGRRILALMLFLTAIVHLDYSDHLWHLYTPRSFLELARDGQRMHARPEDGVRLVEVPFPHWGADFPGFRQLSSIQLQQALPASRDLERCRQAWQRLTPAQRRVLYWIAHNERPQQVAERLGITPKTVDSHLDAIKDVCRELWELPPDHPLSYHNLREWFRPIMPLLAPGGVPDSSG
ncbi:CRISPR-associated ring nuclease [Thermoflexus sp.]|uniref:CRISPR-associated ring nuclease n=1 Tax=Thermoflexus sp. TaxID=1969742 RepID=UPI002ADE4466|nr:CRISPR-associated ring nuclease [Thermoflexus sp.]